ncbi:MAG: hypothetical protein IJK78_07705 [Bacteroidales bacterium]|jgi:hypothetical protein|nr:hypothetical protein [Bacteroidales bacterium]
MKIKDSFWLGLLIGAASFGLFFLLLSLINWESLGVFAKRAPYLLAFIPGVVLFRMMLVKWNLDKMGRGVLAVTIVGMLLVFFLVKSVVNP